MNLSLISLNAGTTLISRTIWRLCTINHQSTLTGPMRNFIRIHIKHPLSKHSALLNTSGNHLLSLLRLRLASDRPIAHLHHLRRKRTSALPQLDHVPSALRSRILDPHLPSQSVHRRVWRCIAVIQSDEASVRVSKERAIILLVQHRANTNIETVTRPSTSCVGGERWRRRSIYLEWATHSVQYTTTTNESDEGCDVLLGEVRF